MSSPTLHGPFGRTEHERFEDMIQKTDTCWNWIGGIKANGYGFFAIKRDGKWGKAHAHRYAYALWVGPIPEGYEVEHVCRNRRCVRPHLDHLDAVTLKENRRRRDLIVNLCPHTQTRTISARWGKPRESCVSCGRIT